MIGKPIAEIAAFQWSQINNKIIDDLASIEHADWTTLSYEDLLNEPRAALESICKFAEVPFGPRMQSFVQDGFPNSKYTLSEPAEEKWQRSESELTPVKAVFESSEERLAKFVLESGK